MADQHTPDQPVDLAHITRIFLIAGEHSGDALGGKLMDALSRSLNGNVQFIGVGGETMEAAGLKSLFPLADVAVMGVAAIVPRLPTIAARVFQTVNAAVKARPDVVVIIDSPEFTHPIASRIRSRALDIPIINYVSPTIWAWRSGRARKMKPYVDHVLALLPFEPTEHKKYGGPPCTYVGHPLVERYAWITDVDTSPLERRLGLDPDRPVIVILPGSRISEVGRLMAPFGETLRELIDRGITPEVIVPTMPNVESLVKARARKWPLTPHFIEGNDDKFRAFRMARAALAASGTVTLELALARTPMVVGYRVDRATSLVRILINAHSIVLANLILGENAFPEYVQEECNSQNFADVLELLIKQTPERTAQLKALDTIATLMNVEGPAPSDTAANLVIEYAKSGRGLPTKVS